MNRKLLIALATTGAFTIGIGTNVVPADPAVRTFVVTLVGASHGTPTLAVPASTPANQLKIPGLPLPVLDIREVTTTATPTPTTTTTPTATPTATAVPTQTPSPTPTATATPTPTPS